ncbi:MAG: hypothetical protein DVB31_02625 [Verrucomicrobia bacterium]|nr:MAG: hypothetical protein DVB31_02625 [Verrucomicrobiota bacterium]
MRHRVDIAGRGRPPLVVVGGALANKPFNGGNAWTRLSWVLGFRRLGLEAWFVEQISAGQCTDAMGRPATLADCVQAAYFHSVMARFGLSGTSALVCEETGESYGVPSRELSGRVGRADLLFNISGHLTRPEIAGGARTKAYLDDDPGHTQFWHESGTGAARCEGHDIYYTIGANIGSKGCRIPTAGLAWHPVRPPVVLAEWPAMPAGEFGRFTTVAGWRGAYGTVVHGGRTYGQKAHEFRRFLDVPARTGERFEIALQIHPADAADLARLRDHGWRVTDPMQASATPDAFRRHVQGSGAEFSAAQGMYVDTHSGWFSDRTARYLASGRPALVQDTGIGRHLPTGRGLLTFGTVDEAVEGVRRIVGEYAMHAAAARRLAEEYLDSDALLRGVLHDVGIDCAPVPAHGHSG